MARPLSSALLPALKEKASSQGSDKSRLRIWAIRHDSGLTRGPARRPLVSTVGLSVPRLQGFKLKLPFKSHCTTSTEFTADLTQLSPQTIHFSSSSFGWIFRHSRAVELIFNHLLYLYPIYILFENTNVAEWTTIKAQGNIQWYQQHCLLPVRIFV